MNIPNLFNQSQNCHLPKVEPIENDEDYKELNSEITKVLQQMEVKDNSQQDKADNINIITDSNANEEKANNISDYNLFNNNYNNIFNNSFDSDTSNNSFHSVKTPHPYIKNQSSSNIFMLGENLAGVPETKIEINNNNYNNYSSFSPMRQMGYQRMRYSGKNLSHFSINNINNNINNNGKPTFSTFLRCNSTNVNNNPQMIFNTITSSFNNNNILNSPMISQNSSSNNINILDSPSNSFRLNHQSSKEFYTPQSHNKKNKKKSLDIPRNKIHLESILRQKDKRTTIMIRHIPNKYTLKLFSDEINKSFFNKYDLLYLPVDIDNHCNLGFGFINFVDSIHIIDFYDRYFGKKWEKFNSDKICELAYAKVQGKEELLKHIEQNGITCDMQVYMTYDIKIEKKSSIELPMKYLQAFLNFYPYSLYRIVSNERFAVDSFYNL